MAIVNKSLIELLEEIEGSECIFEETLSPDNNPEVFSNVETIGGGSITIPNGMYMRRLLAIISPKYQPTHDMYLAEMLANAFERGKPPVTFKVFQGQKGYVLRVEDSGDGFDHVSKVAEMRSGSEGFYQRNGGGLRTLDGEHHQICYEGNGNVVNLQLLKSQ